MAASSDELLAPSILIVDDTPANLNLLCEIIKEQGYKVRPVPNGALALRAAAACPPDLVLLDINMPGMDGFEVCERLKVDPLLKDIPVIFISALTDIEAKVKGFSVGGVDYITKPFQFEEVRARVATHLELRRQRRKLRESYDRLRELEALRDSLVHMLVHDLRSPLAALTAYLGMLKDEAAPLLAPQQQEDIGQALNSAKRMALMITSVLDVNQLEAAEITLRLAECDVVVLAREVVDSLLSLAEDRVLSIRPASVALYATLDRGLVFRVVQNLVANALKFAPASGGEVVLEIDLVEDGIRFRITDNGAGIPAEHQDRIFEKFGQAAGAAVRNAYSNGLGLTFCKLAVEAHGGQIGVDSVVGEGATFWFVLPDSLRAKARECHVQQQPQLQEASA